MNTFQFAVLVLVAGVPGALLQLYLLYLYRREKQEQRTSPVWSAWSELQNELADTLHHPHPEAREMDKLLERLQTFTIAGLSEITDEDRSRLRVLLRERVDDTTQTKGERVRSEFLLFAMPRAAMEQEATAKTFSQQK